MRDNIKHVNSLGEILDFSSPGLHIEQNTLRDFEWKIVSKNEKIFGISKGIEKKTIPIVISAEPSKANEVKNMIFEHFEKDVVRNTQGYFEINNYRLYGFVTKSTKSSYLIHKRCLRLDLEFTCDYPYWIKEERIQFLPNMQNRALNGLNFPTDFPFDFASGSSESVKWETNHYAPSDFEMIIYGPCVNPRVLINEYPYQIFTELEKNEYLILNSKDNTITKFLSNGTTANLYNSRQFSPSVFEKVPGEQLTFNWSGNFGFDLTLYLERSEPKW
jgi:hypothetical protein